ncbi:MAG TPA: hypothetical protein VIK55_05325 [Paludibacter sp.]
MKTTNRIPKAIAVVVIVGLGLVHNMENKHVLAQSFSQVTEEWENAEESDTIKASENKFFIYTKSIIKTSIQHLISNI